MKKLNKLQQLIWERSAQVNLPNPPDKNEVWMRLEQLMDISDIDMSQDQQRFAPPKQGVWSALRHRLNYAVVVGLALVIALPIAYDSLTTETVLTEVTDFQTIRLADGSTISLNAGSRIKYRKDFNTDHRTLTLSGEAYFNVQKGTIPFVINTDHGQVTVLGTSFNVRAREDGFEVGVNDGVVKVSNETKSVLLTVGEMIDVDLNANSLDKQTVSYGDYPDWMHEKLVCERTPLSEVCGEIERTFGVSFKFSNQSLADITVTGVIDAKDLNIVLSTISLLTQHEFKFDGDTCTII